MPKCCVKGCDSSRYTGKKELTFFTFPVHEESLLKKWLDVTETAGRRPSDLIICSLHFTKDDIEDHPDSTQPILKPTSVPTIFPAGIPTLELIDRASLPPISTMVPFEPSAETVNVACKGNSNFPAVDSSPLILVPTQCILQYQGQFPFPVSTRFVSPMIPQFLLSSEQTAAWLDHFPQPMCDKKLAAISNFPQTMIGSSTMGCQILQTSARSTNVASHLSQMNSNNSPRTCHGETANGQGTPRTSHANTNNSKRLCRIAPASEKNPTQCTTSARGVQYIVATNSTRKSGLLRIGARKWTQSCQTLRSSDQCPTQMPRVSQTIVENPAQPVQLHQREITRSVAQPGEISKETGRSSTQSIYLSRGDITPIAEQPQRVQAASAQIPSHRPVQIEHSKSNGTKQWVPDRLSHKAETLSPAIGENQRAQGKSLVSKSNVIPRAIQTVAASRPDILIVPMRRNNGNAKGLEVPRYPGNKRPTLRITINKRYNVPPEPEVEAISGEKANVSVVKNSLDKRITIENTSANKSVTFRLDHQTGEIHLENSEIVDSSTTIKRTRRRRTKRKPSSAMVRKTSSTIRKRSTRARRILKKNPVLLSSSRRGKNSRVTRASRGARR